MFSQGAQRAARGRKCFTCATVAQAVAPSIPQPWAEAKGGQRLLTRKTPTLARSTDLSALWTQLHGYCWLLTVGAVCSYNRTGLPVQPAFLQGEGVVLSLLTSWPCSLGRLCQGPVGVCSGRRRCSAGGGGGGAAGSVRGSCLTHLLRILTLCASYAVPVVRDER